MVMKAILLAMAECMKQTSLIFPQSKVSVANSKLSWKTKELHVTVAIKCLNYLITFIRLVNNGYNHANLYTLCM